MGDEFRYDKYLDKQDPSILQGKMIVDDIHEHSYDKSRYKDEESARRAASDEMEEGYGRRLEYLKSYHDEKNYELNTLFQKNLDAMVPSVPKTIRKKATGVPKQKAAASKLGFGKVKEKYRVFKRSFKNTNATAVTVRESDKLKAYKKNQDEFDKNFLEARNTTQIPGAHDLEVDALKYFVNREETTTEEAKTQQIADNKKAIEDYFKNKDSKEKMLNNALKELINFEMDEKMFTDAYLSANITNMVEMVYKFRAFKDLYRCNEAYFRNKEGIIEKLVFSRGKTLEDFVTGHLRLQGLQIDWSTKTTTTIPDKIKKTDTEKAQDRDNLVRTTLESVNNLKDESRQEYRKMLASTVKVDKNYYAEVDRRYDNLVKRVAQNPGVYDANKDLLRRLAGKAGRYAAILSELEAQIDAYKDLVAGEKNNTLDRVLSENAASTIVENLRNTYAKYEDQYKAYELTILSIVDSTRRFNAEETFLIKDTMEFEKIEQSITEIGVRKDYHEAHYRSIGDKNFRYGESRAENHRKVFVDGMRGQDTFIKQEMRDRLEDSKYEETAKTLVKNKELDSRLTAKYKSDYLIRYAAPKFNNFLGAGGEETLLGNYEFIKSMAVNYDSIIANNMLKDKPQEIVQNVHVNGKMAKFLLKGWEPYIYMIKTGIHFNLPLDKEGEPSILYMEQEGLERLIIEINKSSRSLLGKMPEHMKKYLELAQIQLESVKAKNRLKQKYEGILGDDRQLYFDTLNIEEENNYLTGKMFDKGAKKVEYGTLNIARVVNKVMGTDDKLPSEVKEGITPKLYLAIRPMLHQNVIDTSVRKFDDHGNLEKEYRVIDENKYAANLHILNLFKTFVDDPKSIGEEGQKEINELFAHYYKNNMSSLNYINEDAYKTAINGDSHEYKLNKKIKSETEKLEEAMSKNAFYMLVGKMRESEGVGFRNLQTEEYATILKKEVETQEIRETLDTYMIQNNFEENYTLHTGD
ncbi:hypothetical protein SAMN05216351_101297 [Pseudobutyrivibrio sp. JW11]|uniref:hypothetical protein n=1 Tax=Pseudobutyrivibrio sp. JW11 TaxID=1855302 RepID=UPI0008EB05B2|nr:hypothetical protein [Pseudobutyrivibrio sp. JW11]SFN82831.1 hypothetical protein SAMN05216351_101297 [Pseudobutyrivibrio sp. JW11]